MPKDGPAEWEPRHTVEPLVTLFGPDLKRLRGGQGLFRVELEWKDGRTGLATVTATVASASVCASPVKRVTWLDLNDARFYNGLLDTMATFLKTRKVPSP